MDLLSLALAFASGCVVGIGLDRYIFPIVVPLWSRIVRRAGRDGR